MLMKTNSFLEPVILDGEKFPTIFKSTILYVKLLSTHGSFLDAYDGHTSFLNGPIVT